MGFTVGKISFAAAFLGVFVMYANFWIRYFAAWYGRKEPPRDRVRFGAFAFGVIFFVLGSVLQSQADKVGACTDAGYTLGQCVFQLKN